MMLYWVWRGSTEYSEKKPAVYAFGLVTIGESSVIPDNVKIGKNTAISGGDHRRDYPDGDSGKRTGNCKRTVTNMRAIGIILAGGNNNRMRELSNKRAIAAMPIAGSYRSIDFA